MHGTLTPPKLHRYWLEFWRHSERRLREVPLEMTDFAPAIEIAFFDALRRSRFTEYEPPFASIRIEPRFAREADSPRIAAFTVVLPTPDGGEHAVEFRSDFFNDRAEAIVAELVASGQAAAGSLLFYQLAAYLDDGERLASTRPGITLETAEPAIPIRPGSRRALGEGVPWDNPQTEDLPVLIPRRVLEEAVDEARGTPEREVGGILLGHLRRDTETGDLFLEVTAHVPAEASEATGTSVTFTPETFARAREVIALRGEGEVFVGWVHSHPFRFCAECPTPTPAECIAKVLFFSPEDHFLMRLAFPRPFMVGLQTAVEPRLEPALGHLPVRLYGWRNGEVVARGFEVIRG